MIVASFTHELRTYQSNVLPTKPSHWAPYHSICVGFHRSQPASPTKACSNTQGQTIACDRVHARTLCMLTRARLRAAQPGAHSAPFGPQRAWGRAGCAARPSLPHPAASAGTRVRPPAGEAPPPVGPTLDGGTLPQPQTPRSEYFCSASRCKPLTFNEMKTCWDVDSWIDPTSRLQIGVEAAKH